MPKIHTHYDNLKVARNAPPEVIRAAYKTLSQRFHPDRNSGNDASATRIFQMINSAYEVLSDPAKRQEHDKWIAKAEAEAERAGHESKDRPGENFAQAKNTAPYPRRSNDHPMQSVSVALKGLTAKQRNFIFLFSGVILALLIFIILVS